MDPKLILILGTEGLETGARGIERVSEGRAGREDSDWLGVGGERVGFNLRPGEEESGEARYDVGVEERFMLRGPIGL